MLRCHVLFVCVLIVAQVMSERPVKQGAAQFDPVAESAPADNTLQKVLALPESSRSRAQAAQQKDENLGVLDFRSAGTPLENRLRATSGVSPHSHSTSSHDARTRLLTKLNQKAGLCAHNSASHPLVSLLAEEAKTAGDHAVPGGISALETSGKRPLIVNVAASNYDPALDDAVVFLGLSGLPKRDAYGNTVDASASLCFCEDNSYLNIQGARHAVTAMMHKGESLCMGTCPLGKFILENFEKGTNDDNEYVVQIEELPNAPIRIRIDALEVSKGGINQAMISIQSGDLGQLVPAWISIHGGLQVFIGDLKIGCLKNLRTSSDVVDVGHDRYKPPQSFESVTLSHRNGESDTFYLPLVTPDDTTRLSDAVMDIVRGGDAVLETCYTVPDAN